MENSETILVTGCAGFIGFHVCKDLLKKGNRVIGIDNLNSYYDPVLKNDRLNILKRDKNFSFYKIDISDRASLDKVFKQSKIKKVCHLAAQPGVRYSLENPDVYINANIMGFVRLLEAMKGNGVKSLVFASSSSVYGERKEEFGFREDRESTDYPISVYAATKRAGELLAYTYHHLYSMNITCLRLFTVYGPWGRPDMAYMKFSKAILEGKQLEIYDNGNGKRDFTYVDDIVNGITRAIKKSYPWEVINLGNSEPVDILYFVKILEKELGKSAKLKFSSRQPGDVSQTYADIELARKLLGFEPKTRIEDGLNKFIGWYKKYYKKENSQ